MPPKWQTPRNLLVLMSIAMPLAWATWDALLNNFVVDRANFTGADVGLLHSVREIPGFLAFTAVFVLLLIREQRFALLSLLILGASVALTGFFPTTFGILATTLIMSVGFHYFETIKQSLSLQWLSVEEAPKVLGQLIAASAFASIVVFGLLWLVQTYLALDYWVIYSVGGGLCAALALFMWFAFPMMKETVPQHKHLVIRKRYWLYYALTFMSGARRQIFVVFAAFMMVEKFHFDVADIALLYLVNQVLNMFLAPRIGAWIGRIGERKALMFEYVGLICVFTAYAFVSNAAIAAVLYIIDHIFFSMAIAIKTYFQKIADKQDMAATASVSFTINHIAAVVIPVLFGLLWLVSPAAVFLLGAAMAGVSLLLSLNIPRHPAPGNEVSFGKELVSTVKAKVVGL